MAGDGVAVALVTGGFSLAVAVAGLAAGYLPRRRPDPAVRVQGDPQVMTLVMALSELREEKDAELVELRRSKDREIDLWRARAYEAGWRDD